LAIDAAGYDSEVLAIIHRAEDDSQRCCETCGCAGEPRWNHAGLLQVACNRCAGVPDDSS